MHTVVAYSPGTEWIPPPSISVQEAARRVCAFLDVGLTSFGRSTHYNTQAAQKIAETVAHDELLALDPGLYALLLGLDGLTDRCRQLGLWHLLASQPKGRSLPAARKREVIDHLIGALPPQRLFKTFDSLRAKYGKVNNARTRKAILRTVLNAPSLQLWAAKYRKKLASALRHAWGQRTTSYLRSALAIPATERSETQQKALNREIDRFIDRKNSPYVYECVGFVLGVRRDLTLPLLQAYEEAKVDFQRGADLPYEVLEGIRSVYHPAIPPEESLRITRNTLTKQQRKNFQVKAKKAGVDVRMNARKYTATELYLYAFDVGLDNDVLRALDEKARKAAQFFPSRYERLGVVIDASRSHEGDKAQPLRPMAVTLATRDALIRVGKEVYVGYCGGKLEHGLHRPQGETALAEVLVAVLARKPDAVCIVSDGYENAPAGRVAEVVNALRGMGDATPIFHLNPVFASEAGGVRSLHESIPVMPLQGPESLGMSFLRFLVERDPIQGINMLIQLALRTERKRISHADG